MRIEFHPVAMGELVEATVHYEGLARNLGRDFITAVAEACALLQRFPEAGRSFGKRLRRFPIRRFPYLVVYHLGEDLVRILAVAHVRRHPDYRRNRQR